VVALKALQRAGKEDDFGCRLFLMAVTAADRFAFAPQFLMRRMQQLAAVQGHTHPTIHSVQRRSSTVVRSGQGTIAPGKAFRFKKSAGRDA